MTDPTSTPDQTTEAESDDLEVEPDAAAQVRGGFTPVPIPGGGGGGGEDLPHTKP